MNKIRLPGYTGKNKIHLTCQKFNSHNSSKLILPHHVSWMSPRPFLLRSIMRGPVSVLMFSSAFDLRASQPPQYVDRCACYDSVSKADGDKGSILQLRLQAIVAIGNGNADSLNRLVVYHLPRITLHLQFCVSRG